MYTYQLFCQDSRNGEVFDFSETVSAVRHLTCLDGQPGKLTFNLEVPLDKPFSIPSGSIISFVVDGLGIFYGFVFNTSVNQSGQITVTAYDQTRYLKNREFYLTENMTASDIFLRVCQDSLPYSKYEVLVPSVYVPPPFLHEKRTLYEIIDYGIRAANTNETDRHYFIRDKFGVLQFTELKHETTNIIIGEKSLLTSYRFDTGIENDTYNRVKIYRDNKQTGLRDVWIESDNETARQWGTLQYAELAPADFNEAQIRELAQNYLKLHNKESKTLSVTALGVKEILAGSGFYMRIDALGLNCAMWVSAAEHVYTRGYHHMNLEVFL